MKIPRTVLGILKAAWIKAETGVGPSILSGSQVCRPNWADLAIAPIKNNSPIMVRTVSFI